MELDPHLAYSIRSRRESSVRGKDWQSSSLFCSLCGSWQEESWLSWLFEKVVVIMVCFFVCSIVNSMAQSYAKRKRQEKYSESKAEWRLARDQIGPSPPGCYHSFPPICSSSWLIPRCVFREIWAPSGFSLVVLATWTSICLFLKALHLVGVCWAACERVETALMLVLLGAPRDNSPQ